MQLSILLINFFLAFVIANQASDKDSGVITDEQKEKQIHIAVKQVMLAIESQIKQVENQINPNNDHHQNLTKRNYYGYYTPAMNQFYPRA
jgi:conjugal transfer/entry exclusion protein